MWVDELIKLNETNSREILQYLQYPLKPENLSPQVLLSQLIRNHYYAESFARPHASLRDFLKMMPINDFYHSYS